MKFAVTARHHLPHVTIVSNQETGEVVVVVVVALSAPVVVTEAATVARMEDHTEGHLVLTGGATDCCPSECTVLSSDRLCCTDMDHL